MTPAAVKATSSSASNDPVDAAAPKRFDTDPADPTRKVPHKKANGPFLVHQRWKAQQQKAREDAMAAKIVELPADAKVRNATTTSDARRKAAGLKKSAAEPKRGGVAYFLFKWSLVALFLALGAGQFIAGDVLWNYRGKYLKKQTYFPPTDRIFSVEELWEHNGEDENKPIYLSILGHVYDVTSGRWVYGKRGSYRFFAGRDASRAYVTGCFNTHLTHDLRGLTADELWSINEWKLFFDNHARYTWIGKADLPPIDKSTPIPPSCHDSAEQKSPDEVQAGESTEGKV